MRSMIEASSAVRRSWLALIASQRPRSAHRLMSMSCAYGFWLMRGLLPGVDDDVRGGAAPTDLDNTSDDSYYRLAFPESRAWRPGRSRTLGSAPRRSGRAPWSTPWSRRPLAFWSG